MGINPTLPNFKSFTFGGVNSRSYGVYITGEGVFNAPERNVEMIDIAGRNGAFALDKGNFNNIEVTYPASIATDAETDFADAVSDLRNFLCSKIGYVRLEDEYNPNEYRMAIYKSGLEVSHDMLTNGKFDITFECKPQRYLTSGETAISVASGGTITNPTLFDARPLLQFNGYGGINIGASSIYVDNVPLGYIMLGASVSESVGASVTTKTITRTFDDSLVNSADSITLISCSIRYLVYKGNVEYATCVPSDSNASFATSVAQWNSNYATIETQIADLPFVVGTSASVSNTTSVVFTKSNNTTFTFSVTLQISYDGVHTIAYSVTKPSTNNGGFSVTTGDLFANSSVSALLSNTGYIDCDIGECYMIKNGVIIQINNATQLQAELPLIKSGSNSITYDNTITNFKITPRWWKV